MLSVTPASKRSCTENKQLSIKAMHSFGSNENKQKAAESPSRAAYRCSLRSCCHQCPLELSPSWTQLPATRHYDPTESCVLRDFTEIHELQKKKYMGNSFPIIFQLLKLVLQAGFLPVPHRALTHFKLGRNSLLWWSSRSNSQSPSPSSQQEHCGHFCPVFHGCSCTMCSPVN